MIAESIFKLARAAYDIHVGQFATLPEHLQQHPKMARLIPGRSVEEDFREALFTSFKACEGPLSEYTAYYGEFVETVRTFERSSLSKGMSWSSVVGGVGAGLFGGLGAVIGGIASALLSDQWELRKLRQGWQRLNDLANNVVITFRKCDKSAWDMFMECAYIVATVEESIEGKSP